MKNLLLTTALALTLTACASTRVIDTQTDKLQVEISASAPDRRADAVFNGALVAARETLNRGYDLYIIEDINSTPTSTTVGGGFDTMSLDLASRSISTIGGLVVATLQSGEASIKVRMFKYGEKRSEKALDAREQLKRYENPELAKR